MKILTQIGIVFLICLVGEVVSSLLPFAFPGSVISMILLFLLLVTKVLKPIHIEQKANFLMKYMPFFFIPAGVAILEHTALLKSTWLPLLLVSVITTILTFAATGYTVMWVIKWQVKRTEKARNQNGEHH